MNPKLQQIRKRLFNDFPFYAKSALKIRTKEGQVAPLGFKPGAADTAKGRIKAISS